MIRSLKEMKGYKLLAEGDQFGKIKDIYFDSDEWTVRYLVVETGSWLNSRQVLVPPQILGLPDWNNQVFPTSLTKQQIKDSPPVDTDRPVSRQYETDLYSYWGWTPYWVRTGAMAPMPPGPTPGYEPEETAYGRRTAGADTGVATQREGDPDLRSLDEVTGYGISAVDDDIGHAEDFLVDDESWDLRYLVVDTRNFLPGRKVIVSTQWITGIDWPDSRVSVDLTADDIKNSPEYDPKAPINRDYEERLYTHYGRPRYWNY
ncbi:MAG: PRC-barrel domain containing protein [Candidatus Zixiibacteriota bacterium]|nr:MAG: PRC-barrel domain containing protein [candidate division Zixibacteria bacterium]